MMQKTKIPEQIITAIEAMLKPYGVDAANLIHQQPEQRQANSESRYLSLEAAERYCCVSRWTIGRAVKAGKIPQIKLSDAKQGKVLIDRKDLDKWLSGMKKHFTVNHSAEALPMLLQPHPVI